MYKNTRFCPECNKELFYSCSSSYCLSRKRNSLCTSCSNLKKANRQNECSFLLKENLLRYYWLGFILADGHISNKDRLNITLAIKDINHLEKLAKLLNTKVKITKHGQCFISLMNTKVLSVLKDIYKIKSNKTENPCDISLIKGDNLKALSIGFIDGDGNITNTAGVRKDFQIRIKTHKSWLENLKYMYGKAYINNSGYALTCISNTKESKKLKEFAINNSLPILKRKWEIVNLNYNSRTKNKL